MACILFVTRKGNFFHYQVLVIIFFISTNKTKLGAQETSFYVLEPNTRYQLGHENHLLLGGILLIIFIVYILQLSFIKSTHVNMS